MRFIFLFICILFIVNGYSQRADLKTVQDFWNANIVEIINLKNSEIIEHTNFPLEGSWGYAIDYESEESSWTSDLYKNNLSKVFTSELRNALSEMNYNQLVHHTDENGELNFILQAFLTTNVDGDTFESSTILYFKKFDGIWKLFKVELIG
jgi:hypothetical protein